MATWSIPRSTPRHRPPANTISHMVQPTHLDAPAPAPRPGRTSFATKWLSRTRPAAVCRPTGRRSSSQETRTGHRRPWPFICSTSSAAAMSARRAAGHGHRSGSRASVSPISAGALSKRLPRATESRPMHRHRPHPYRAGSPPPGRPGPPRWTIRSARPLSAAPSSTRCSFALLRNPDLTSGSWPETREGSNWARF
jgi:hypothetical protein